MGSIYLQRTSTTVSSVKYTKNLLRAFARDLSFIHGEHKVCVVVPETPKHKTKLDPFHRNAHLYDGNVYSC